MLDLVVSRSEFGDGDFLLMIKGSGCASRGLKGMVVVTQAHTCD